jgi:hypothetical protein
MTAPAAKPKRPRFKVTVAEEDAWQVIGPSLNPAARKLSREALRALQAAVLTLPEEAADFLVGALYESGPRGRPKTGPRSDPALLAEWESRPQGETENAFAMRIEGGHRSRADATRKHLRSLLKDRGTPVGLDRWK